MRASGYRDRLRKLISPAGPLDFNPLLFVTTRLASVLVYCISDNNNNNNRSFGMTGSNAVQ